MKKVSTRDVAVRFAIWNAHSRKCYYTGEPLSFIDMELDHIIPQHLKDKPIRLTRILQSLHLNDDFELDSVYNLVPTKGHHNKSKGKALLPAAAIWLKKIKRKAPKIESEIEKLSNGDDVGSKQNVVLAGCVWQHGFKRLHEYRNYADVHEKFEDSEEIFKIGSYLYLNQSRATVAMAAGINRKNISQSYFSFIFSNPTLSGMIINLSYSDIIDSFFIGVNSPYPDSRGFVETPSDGLYWVKLGTCSMQLNAAEADQLGVIVDKVAKLYLDACGGLVMPSFKDQYELANFIGRIKQNVYKQGPLKMYLKKEDIHGLYESLLTCSKKLVKNKDASYFAKRILSQSRSRIESLYTAMAELELRLNSSKDGLYDKIKVSDLLEILEAMIREIPGIEKENITGLLSTFVEFQLTLEVVRK